MCIRDSDCIAVHTETASKGINCPAAVRQQQTTSDGGTTYYGGTFKNNGHCLKKELFWYNGPFRKKYAGGYDTE